MNALQEHSRSVWMDVKVASHAKSLSKDLTIDVVVIGAGIAGLSVAYELLQRGRSVAVVDRGAIAGGMTARTTAHLAPICDDSLAGLISMRGTELSRTFQDSQSAGVDRIETIQSKESIDCEFRRLDGILFLDPTSEESVLQDEIDAAKKLKVAVNRDKGLPAPRTRGDALSPLPQPGDLSSSKIFEWSLRRDQSKGRTSSSKHRSR